MKLKDLEMHCGECTVIDFCGEPYSDICLCKNEAIEHLEDKDYIKIALSIKEQSKRNWSNKSIEKRVMKQCKGRLRRNL